MRSTFRNYKELTFLKGDKVCKIEEVVANHILDTVSMREKQGKATKKIDVTLNVADFYGKTKIKLRVSFAKSDTGIGKAYKVYRELTKLRRELGEVICCGTDVKVRATYRRK